MKQFMKLSMLLFLFVAVSCSSNRQVTYPPAQVSYLSDGEGTITVQSIGFGSSEGHAVANAEQGVFEALFFRGIPESSQKQPLIGTDEFVEKLKHKDYFNEFYNLKRYSTFIVSSTLAGNPVKASDGGRMVTLDVKVNLSALRHDLETFNVIRKFGY